MGRRLASTQLDRRRRRRIVIGTTVIATITAMAIPATAQVIAPVELKLMVSEKVDRSAAVDLDGAEVSDTIAVFSSSVRTTASVSFWVDDPQRASSPTSSDAVAPFDLAGTASGGGATLFDTKKLANGEHSITAVQLMRSGAIHTTTAYFAVANGSGATNGSATTTTAADGGATTTTAVNGTTTTSTVVPITTTTAPEDDSTPTTVPDDDSSSTTVPAGTDSTSTTTAPADDGETSSTPSTTVPASTPVSTGGGTWAGFPFPIAPIVADTTA